MATCGDFSTCFSTYMPHAIEVAFAVIAVASAVAAATKTPRDDELAGRAYRIVDTLALNFGYAKEKPARDGGRFVPE